jgi:prolyl oligopeptidase
MLMHNRTLVALLFIVLASMALWSRLERSHAAYTEDDEATTKADSHREKRPTMLDYPETRRGDTVDDYHGTKVPDPYRWLEDPDSPETREWIEAENRVTESYLSQIPQRKKIRKRLTELWNYERYGLPWSDGSYYFYTHNDGLQNQSVLMVAGAEAFRADASVASPLGREQGDGGAARAASPHPNPLPEGEGVRVLLDPNKLSEDGTVSLAGSRVSDDGKYLAYGLASGGSDWNEWHVRDVATGQDLDDHLKWVKFSDASWTKDGRGFYYSRYDEPPKGEVLTQANYFQKVFYHKLATDQSDDKLVYDRKDHKDWGFSGEVTDDGKYLVINVWQGTRRENQVFYQELDGKEPGEAKTVELLAGFDADYSFVGNDGARFYFLTDKDAPRRRLIAIDVKRPQREHWQELVPQAEDILQRVSLVGDQFFATYLKDASSRIKVFDLAGKHMRDVVLPGIGSATGFDGDRDDKETFYGFSSYTTPTTIYRYDLASGESTLWRRPKIDFDSDKYETKQLFTKSKDGTRVPLFVTHKTGLKLDGNNPTLLYGYGGFNIALTPGFDVRSAVWMEMGGVYAVATLRGGGEYGVEWHEGGRLHNKQNVFDDFFAAAEHLIEQKYTQPEKLAIAGRSNGGLLVGAAMTQRPDLFGATLPGVGVMDMLRFHKFTIGWAWVSEYGSADDPEVFPTLYRYSPLHNLKADVKYPATLIVTADHDDRVVPAHSFKFAAALQAAQRSSAHAPPVLIRIETRAGHGAGMALKKKIDETTDELAFLVQTLGM